MNKINYQKIMEDEIKNISGEKKNYFFTAAADHAPAMLLAI